MRTDGSFHGSFTLAPLPTAWSLMRPGATDEHGSFACGKLDARKNICANLRDLWETTKRPMRLKKQMRDFAHRSHRATQMPCGVILSKNTDITDAHGWVFSRIIYSCSASCCLVFGEPLARRMSTDLSHAESWMQGKTSVQI